MSIFVCCEEKDSLIVSFQAGSQVSTAARTAGAATLCEGIYLQTNLWQKNFLELILKTVECNFSLYNKSYNIIEPYRPIALPGYNVKTQGRSKTDRRSVFDSLTRVYTEIYACLEAGKVAVQLF